MRRDLEHETHWPVIKTRDPARLAAFYRDVLGFAPATAAPTDAAGSIALSLDLVRLVLSPGIGGLQFTPDRMQKRYWLSPPPGDDLILLLPVRESSYAKERRSALSGVPHHIELIQDFFSLTLRDADGNWVQLYRDYHGPYERHAWEWSFDHAPKLATGGS